MICLTHSCEYLFLDPIVLVHTGLNGPQYAEMVHSEKMSRGLNLGSPRIKVTVTSIPKVNISGLGDAITSLGSKPDT